ncbi:uncharacterized protein LODBEIA_P05090 [Lodderomyces beijingensis]|uniref:Uncharacterized protein n=1 Tax=Lodderomyces beijingensis TaxID=1775926 RepID=A0ABP0ZIX0_9ASCO
MSDKSYLIHPQPSLTTTPPTSNSSIHNNPSGTTNQFAPPPPPPPPPYSKAAPTTSTNTSEINISPNTSSNMSPPRLQEQRSFQQLAHYQQLHDLQLQQQQQQRPQHHDQRDVSAAEALTQLTRTNSPSSDVDTIITTEMDSASVMSEEHELPLPPHRHPLVSTVSMVAKHPIVVNAINYYETSKRNYPSFSYAAGIVEAATIPVVTKIEDNLNTRHQIQSRISSNASNPPSAATSVNITPVVSFDNKQKKRRFSTASQTSNTSITSYDVKKRLQFCIHILRAANANINSKINFLQTKIDETEEAVREERVKLEIQRSHESQQVPPLQSPTDEATQKTKSEIVTTVRKIIHLISNFRPSTLNQVAPVSDADGNALSPTSSHKSATIQEYELKNTIRDIILHLPASLQRSDASANGNDRVFVFAKESLDMITKLTNVFSEHLVKIESWVTGEEEQALFQQQAQQQQQQQQQQSVGLNEKEDVEVREEKSDDSVSTRCSSEEPDALTSATKRMRIDELVT